ncbi:MAG TPA: tryptophan synthase subunit alpha [Micavibrio sp.]|nr:tryptophan synthase subunit alpha [Micavibrio sp.]
MNRIARTFAKVKAEGRKALVTFTMAGDPDGATSLAILERLAKSADILEIGMPFTDPMADGPAVQAAGLRALAAGATMARTLDIVQQFRSKNQDTPIVLMGYFNPMLFYGIEKFCNDCNSIGVDGFIIVDVPPEEADEIAPKAQQSGIAFIRLLAPTTDEARLRKILKDAGGFLYYVSVAGVTGTASADPVKAGAHIGMIRKHTQLPIVAGFGIKTPADAAAMGQIADGVVVGSALVQEIEKAQAGTDLPERLGARADALAAALRQGK